MSTGASTGGSGAYLDAAKDCLLDLGWRRTTLTEVARRAGVSRMTIYRSWPDMPALLSDLMTREWGHVVLAAIAGADAALPADATAADRLVGEVVAVSAAMRDDDIFGRIVELDPELLLPYLLQRRGRSQEAIVGLAVARIHEGQADGSVRDGDPTTMARGLLLAAHGFVLSARTMTDDDVSLADLDAELARLVRGSLAPATP